jgi:maltooligosyltrehalose trehalohydrolase
VADFPGQRNWGYDAVLPFAPDSSYGTADELKDLIAAAHLKGLMVFNDVVYSHLGPEGNYLHLYAPAFFMDRFQTPWGNAVNFDSEQSYWVRQFFIHNALYWLEEYHFDGLRFDAAHCIFDDSSPDILEVLAETARLGPGYDRHIHLVLENDNNAAHYLRHNPLRPYRYFNAQWNDDIHHALHVLLTGETAGYYQDYKQQPISHLGRCLAEGFAYQGEVSDYREGKQRGEPCLDLSLSAFISFLQNHDQTGNRALGERISALCTPEALRAVTAILLLAPSPPLLFMGQEWACSQPFTYFVDFPEELGNQVNQERLYEFTRLLKFTDIELQKNLPIPTSIQTFQAAKLAWNELTQEPHRQWLEYHQKLLRIRSRYIIPRIKDITGKQAHYRLLSDKALSVQWRLSDDSTLILVANLGGEPVSADYSGDGELLFASRTETTQNRDVGLSPWEVIFYLEESKK